MVAKEDGGVFLTGDLQAEAPTGDALEGFSVIGKGLD